MTEWRDLFTRLSKLFAEVEETRFAVDGEFEESKHKRDHGKFSSETGVVGSGAKFEYGIGKNKPLTNEEQNLANEKLDGIASFPYEKSPTKKFVKTEDIGFKKHQEGMKLFGFNREWGEERTVDPKEVYRSQQDLPLSGLQQYIEHLDKTLDADLPHIAKTPSGELWVASGHTRLGAQLLAGRASVRAIVHEYRETPSGSLKEIKTKRKSDGAKDISPNSAIPTGAGVMLVDPAHHVLFVKRSDECDHPGEWAFPGGRCEGEETAKDCARRETKEELGYDLASDDTLEELCRFPGDIDYTTYRAFCDNRFNPELNGEHTSHVWSPWGSAPSPLHPGVDAALEKAGWYGGVAEDIDLKRNPDGSLQPTVDLGNILPNTTKELRKEGTLAAAQKHPGPKYNGAEDAASYKDVRFEATTDHEDIVSDRLASDCLFKDFRFDHKEPTTIAMDWRGAVELYDELPVATTYAFDRDTTRSYDADGHLHVAAANISKANICPYLGKEIPDWEELGLDPNKRYRLLRDPKEIEKAASTFNNLPILDVHKPISADTHDPDLVIGSTGTDAVFKAPHLINSLVFWPRSAIKSIESAEKKQLSAAYRYSADMTPGVYDGERYDGVMRDLEGSHVALVREGRAGPDVMVGDGAPLVWRDVRWCGAKDAKFEESKHPRGQPGNAGEFGPGGGNTSSGGGRERQEYESVISSQKIAKELDRVSSSFVDPKLSDNEKDLVYSWKIGNSTLLGNSEFIKLVEKGRVTKPITVYRAGGTSDRKVLEFTTRKSWAQETAEASDRKVVEINLEIGDSALFVPFATKHHLVEMGVLLPPETQMKFGGAKDAEFEESKHPRDGVTRDLEESHIALMREGRGKQSDTQLWHDHHWIQQPPSRGDN